MRPPPSTVRSTTASPEPSPSGDIVARAGVNVGGSRLNSGAAGQLPFRFRRRLPNPARPETNEPRFSKSWSSCRRLSKRAWILGFVDIAKNFLTGNATIQMDRYQHAPSLEPRLSIEKRKVRVAGAQRGHGTHEHDLARALSEPRKVRVSDRRMEQDDQRAYAEHRERGTVGREDIPPLGAKAHLAKEAQRFVISRSPVRSRRVAPVLSSICGSPYCGRCLAGKPVLGKPTTRLRSRNSCTQRR